MTDPNDLHPYDGQERRFLHDDRDPAKLARAHGLVARLLRLPAPPPLDGLQYDMRFYSGGMGSSDRIRIALPRTPAEVDALVAARRLATPEEAVADAAMRDDFEFVVLHEEDPQPLRVAVAAFVMEHRAEFQPIPEENSRVWFSRDTGPNAWTVVYEREGVLALIADDDG
jgi:hypothetical protein